MKLDQLIDHLYWILKFGRPVKKISAESLFNHPDSLKNPVFFLSTGRCGTEWFSYALNKEGSNRVFHAPLPNLSVQNKFLFSQRLKGMAAEEINALATQLLFAGREQHFRYAVKSNKRYIETNNHITFFAFTLAQLFPTAKFIHLYRHPGDFVTSGMNRGWFDGNEDATSKMIQPMNVDVMSSYSRIQKIGWVWNETNAFIEAFKAEYADRCFAYDFTQRDVPQLVELFDFLNVPMDETRLKKMMSHKRNVQKSSEYPSYASWSEADKRDLVEVCGKLAEQYGYSL